VKQHFDYGKVLLVVILAGILFSSCKKKEQKDPNAGPKGNWFSIRQFGIDQWNSYVGGTPFVILKTVKVNNKIDSSYTNSDTLNWGNIFKTFFETDISDSTLQDQYTYTAFYDNEDMTLNLFYKANDPDLFTQKLEVTVDQYTRKVRGIYIETYKKDVWGEYKQKLVYVPMRSIQMQEDEKPLFGAKKYVITEYSFMRQGL